MNKLFALFIMLALIDNAFAQWVPQTSGILSSDLSSVYFTNANTGYAVGYYVNTAYPYGNSGLLLKTTNGGGEVCQAVNGVWNRVRKTAKNG